MSTTTEAEIAYVSKLIDQEVQNPDIIRGAWPDPFPSHHHLTSFGSSERRLQLFRPVEAHIWLSAELPAVTLE